MRLLFAEAFENTTLSWTRDRIRQLYTEREAELAPG